jgi:hypothetical protein
MSAAPTGSPAAGVSAFELTISNPTPAPARLALAVNDPSGVLHVSVPTPLTLKGSEVLRVPVEVRQVAPAPPGERLLEFQVTAHREDGSRAGFVNLRVTPAAAGGGGRGAAKSKGGPSMWWFAAGGIALAAAIGMGVVALQGGGEKTAPATPTGAVSATVEPGTPGVTATPATTPTAGQPTAAPTQPPTAIPTAGAGSIQVLDRWDYAFRITSNNCPFGAAVGDRYAVSFRFEPATGTSKVINDGDRVRVTAVQDRDIDLGVFTFRFVDWKFTYPVVASGGQRGTATLTTTFADSRTIAKSSLVEDYPSPGCTITGAPFGN